MFLKKLVDRPCLYTGRCSYARNNPGKSTVFITVGSVQNQKIEKKQEWPTSEQETRSRHFYAKLNGIFQKDAANNAKKYPKYF